MRVHRHGPRRAAPPNSLLLTVREAGDELRRSSDYVRTLIKTGKLPAHREGSVLRIKRKDLERYVDRQSSTIVSGLRALGIV